MAQLVGRGPHKPWAPGSIPVRPTIDLHIPPSPAIFQIQINSSLTPIRVILRFFLVLLILVNENFPYYNFHLGTFSKHQGEVQFLF